MALSWAECHLFLCIFLSSWDVRVCSPRGALEPRQSLAPSLAVWRALFPALLPVRLFSPSFLEPRKWAQGRVQSQGAGQWQSPAFQPCSLALELSFLNAVTSCFLGGVAGRTRGARGHRVLLVTVFCFLFFLLGPRGVRVSALGAGSEADISRVPSGAPSRDLGGEGSRTGPKGGGLS